MVVKECEVASGRFQSFFVLIVASLGLRAAWKRLRWERLFAGQRFGRQLQATDLHRNETKNSDPAGPLRSVHPPTSSTRDGNVEFRRWHAI